MRCHSRSRAECPPGLRVVRGQVDVEPHREAIHALRHGQVVEGPGQGAGVVQLGAVQRRVAGQVGVGVRQVVQRLGDLRRSRETCTVNACQLISPLLTDMNV